MNRDLWQIPFKADYTMESPIVLQPHNFVKAIPKLRSAGQLLNKGHDTFDASRTPMRYRKCPATAEYDL